MSKVDFFILAIYMLGILILGFYLGRSNKSSRDYFTGSRALPWYAVGLSVGATMISANAFIGGPGWAYDIGLIAIMMNFTVPIAVLFSVTYVIPVIYESNVTTVYEYINLRLGKKSRILNLTIWLLTSLILMGGFVYTPALLLEQVTSMSFSFWVPVIVLFSIFYTAAGGIKAVIWTDSIQSVVLFFGVLFSIIYVIYKMPLSFSEIIVEAKAAEKLISYDFEIKWTTMNIVCSVLGGLAMWLGYFGFDQGQVQRYLSSQNINSIRKGGVVSVIAMQVVYFSCLFLGVLLYLFYQNHESTLDFSNSNLIMTDFMVNYIPSGLLGLLLAATFSAAMSSIDSILNSMTAVFTKDIYEPYISRSDDTPISKSIIFSIVFGLVIIGFVYFGLEGSSKSILDTMGGYMAPFGSMITGIMIVCIFVPRVNDNGAFFGVISSGTILISVQMIYDYHWLWAFFFGSTLCVVFSYILSLFFKDESQEKLKYTYLNNISNKENGVINDQVFY